MQLCVSLLRKRNHIDEKYFDRAAVNFSSRARLQNTRPRDQALAEEQKGPNFERKIGKFKRS